MYNSTANGKISPTPGMVLKELRGYELQVQPSLQRATKPAHTLAPPRCKFKETLNCRLWYGLLFWSLNVMIHSYQRWYPVPRSSFVHAG